MNRTKRFFYNSLTTAFYQIIVMLAGFITPLIMLKYYGSEINGLVSSINQFITYFNLVEAGLSSAAIYALYKPLADKDYKGVNGVVSAARIFYIQAGYIFISLTIGLAVFYPFLVEVNALSTFNVSLLVLVLGVNGALEFFTLAKYRVLLSADQRTYIISMASLIHIIINTSIVVILGTMQVDIVILRVVALFSIFIRSLILMIYVKTKYKYINYKEKPNNMSLNKRWDALYLQVLGAIQVGAPVVILTLITRDLKLVSVYTIFNMVIVGLNGVLRIFNSGLSASFGNVIAKGEKKVLQKAFNEFEFSFYCLITIIFSVAFITIMPFIRIYTADVTDINYDIPILGFLFVLNGFLYNIKTPQGMLVMSAGMFKETKVQTTIQGLIVVIIGLVLTPFIGLYGVLIGSILSNIYRGIDLIFFISRNITKLPKKTTYLRLVRSLFIMLIGWLPFFIFDYTPQNFIEWGIYAIIVGLYSFIAVILISLLFDRFSLKSALVRIKGIIRR